VDELHALHDRLQSAVESVGERDVLGVRPTRFAGHLRPRVIDEYARHDPRSYSEEMAAIVPRHVAQVAEAEVGLVGERGRLQGGAARSDRRCRAAMARSST
jgi:hypothetical protein